MTDHVSAATLNQRTIRHADLKPDDAAFIDTKLPGSQGKVNYPLIGAGVSENPNQVIPVSEPHGFALGAAVMTEGVVNSLHLHFTAEVFMCFGGEWQFRWGSEDIDGEAIVREGDVISIPTWVFRGFTSLSDDAWLYTALGRDQSGGLIWYPDVLHRASELGMYLTTDGRIIDHGPGAPPPSDEPLVTPMTHEELASLQDVSVDQMRQRLARPDDLEWNPRPFLDSTLPGGGAELAVVVGHGMTQDRRQQPRLVEPHGLTLAWLRAEPGAGMLRHRHDRAQAVIVKHGRFRVACNTDDAEVAVDVGPFDTVSLPPGAWRRFEVIGDEPAQLAMITQGDGQVPIEWHPDVVTCAREEGVAVDANGYIAPAHLIGH